ncbi:MAG: RagB/SusD family nutrient uptake outer membrane protein [Alistipes sp.]|nr:RagB/SusD family nutrient uptake outer membrane protein [Rikenellaceae bacterium]MBQ2843286.1 RagB/SusD family nutrient uptake outer membrane protein [Alistipes sp.]
MKTKNILKGLLVLGCFALLTPSCTNLDEELYGRLTPDSFFQTEEEAVSSVAGAYNYFARMFQAGGDGWRSAEYGTDELMCPGRSNGGWLDENVNQMMRHEVIPFNDRLNGLWNCIFPGIGLDNSLIETFEASPLKDQLKGVIAEVRALRAYQYYYAMDCFGNVPICTDARVSTTNLPTTSPRADVFNFVVEEFKLAIADLPSVKDVDASYYPRFTKESAQAALAFVYLNGEVYSGKAYWKEVVDLCDAIINTGAFDLEGRVGDCFRADMEGKTKEVITAISVDKSKGVDGNQFILYAQHATDQQKYGLPFAPACGYCFDDTALNRYEEGDERLELLEYGPQFYLDGTPIMDPDHAGQQLVLTTIKDFIAAENNEGYRVLKYTPIGASFAGSDGNNDYIVERYSNVLLMKAEALVRQGQNLNTALDLVNKVRNRSELPSLTAGELTLAAIEKERANEFIWEGKRRPDMIRFGSYFNTTWSYKKTVTPEWRGIYPIPGQQISANPNLKQNPNYE